MPDDALPRLERLRSGETDALLSFLIEEQANPAHAVPYLGETREGICAELEELAPIWEETLRIGRDPDGAIGAAIFAHWDEEVGLAWIHGPWAREGAWSRFARPLLDAVRAEIPARAARHELCGHTANTRMAALAAELGWKPTEVNHALVLEGTALVAAAAGGPVLGAGLAADAARGAREVAAVRPAVPTDHAAIDPLHAATFPHPYYSAEQLLEQKARVEAVVLVAEQGGDGFGPDAAAGAPAAPVRFAGYIAGRIRPDGDGYIDFLAVDPAIRGRGHGRALVGALLGTLCASRGVTRVCLTVRDSLAPARALYADLGFRTEASILGYRSSTSDPPHS